MEVGSLDELFVENLKDIYSAENQIIKALPKMIKKCSAATLKEALEGHLETTKNQVSRLEEIGKILGAKLKGKKCAGMQGLIKEGEEALEMEPEGPVVDAAIIAAAQKVEHYEISAYGTLRAFAERLDRDDVVKLLQQTLDEEGEADHKLTDIAEQDVNFEASETEESEESEEEEEETDTEEEEEEEER